MADSSCWQYRNNSKLNNSITIVNRFYKNKENRDFKHKNADFTFNTNKCL